MTTKVTGSVLADTAVTPGTYGGTQTLPAFTVDAQGRITYAANITSGVITAGTRGQGADIIVPTIQYNALGQIVAGTNTTIRTATTSVTGVVQLADSVSNTSTTAAATASAVKAAYDAAGANASTALSSAQANTGAGLIIVGARANSGFSQANLAFDKAGLAFDKANTASNADNLSSGTVPSARISGSYTGITGIGTLTTGSVPNSLVSGLASSATTNALNASNISSGTLPSARISGSYTGITGVGTLTSGSVASLAEFASSLTGTGYQKLPGGLIIQWGTHYSTGGGYQHTLSYTASFAITFPQGSPFVIVPHISCDVSTGITGIFVRLTASNGAGFTYQFGSINGGQYHGSVSYIAIGY
jgi:hypothetical protein